MKKKKCDCGWTALENLMLKLGMDDCIFDKCCEAHDKEYKRGIRPRKDVDREFLACMLEKADGKWYYKTMAYTLYYIVRGYGWIMY